MPSAGDQLSKLTGTTLVCVSMCFLMPSLAINGERESISNMIALSLFVVTIAVNICIQIYTGVIFSFIVEHIMIICCMLLFLPVLWTYTFLAINEKITFSETMKNTIKKREASSSLLHQVKLWYMSSSISNPQYFVRGSSDIVFSVEMICFLCLTVLLQATLRSLAHNSETCEGISDYGWSIPIILVTQIVTVVVMSLSTIFRWIVMVSDPTIELDDKATTNEFNYGDMYFEVEMFSYQSLSNNRELRKVSILLFLYLLLKGVILFVVLLTYVVLEVPPRCVRSILKKITGTFHAYCHASSTNSSTAVVLEKWKTELREVFSPTKDFPNWIMTRSVKEMNKWTDLSNRSPPNYLVQLLSKPRIHHPPQTLLNKLQVIGKAKGYYYKLSCLSMAILVKVVALSVSFTLAEPILRATNEAFEIVYYIDKKVNVGNFQDGKKRRFAKFLLAQKNGHLTKKDSNTNNLGMSVNETLSSITNEWKAFPDGLGKREMKIIRDFLYGQEYASTEELYEDLEQLFVDMLLFFLSQLPIVTLKDVNESPIEFLEERARSALKVLCKLKLLEDKVQWLFPEGITTLMGPDDEEDNNSDQARSTENLNLVTPAVDQDGGNYIIQVPNAAASEIVETSSNV
ncbi:hypothetical protein Sjap_009446 [Stephania japonica]|uniref:Uncharacterized protein n=1 Tax=Stephania japonica TaxID=461633 RepID=A0AAP0JRG6_9MAGN